MSTREDGMGLESGNRESGMASCSDCELSPDDVEDDGSPDVVVMSVVGTSLERCELVGRIRVSGCVLDRIFSGGGLVACEEVEGE